LEPGDEDVEAAFELGGPVVGGEGRREAAQDRELDRTGMASWEDLKTGCL